LKNRKNRRELGDPPPNPLASGGWGLCSQTPSLQRSGTPRPPLASGSWERSTQIPRL